MFKRLENDIGKPVSILFVSFMQRWMISPLGIVSKKLSGFLSSLAIVLLKIL